MSFKGIALRGKLRVGKDTCYKELKEIDERYVRLSFADQLKEMASDLTNINMFIDENKVEHRKFLISLGQTMRVFDKDYWVKPVMHKAEKLIEEGKIPVITDVRFTNEADALRKAGFMVTNLFADPEALQKRGWHSQFDNDPSEKELDLYGYFNCFVDTSVLRPRQVAVLVNDAYNEEEEEEDGDEETN